MPDIAGAELKDRVAVVTGAGRGIGRAAALALAGQGARVALWSKTGAPLLEVAEEIESKGGESLALEVDVSSREQVKDALARTEERFGPVDILVNNAGLSLPTPLAEMSLEEWNRIMAINATSVFLCCQAVMAGMKSRGRGRIVNIGSLGGKTGGRVSGAHYCASKAAVHAFSICLAQEMAPFGVTVNVVAPGPIRTDLLSRISKGDLAMWTSVVPLGRLGLPEDVAGVISFLCSDRAGFITGEVVDVNGGMLMD